MEFAFWLILGFAAGLFAVTAVAALWFTWRLVRDYWEDWKWRR